MFLQKAVLVKRFRRTKSMFSSRLKVVIPVSYTHLDVYKRQDVEGGTTAFMLQQILEKQKAFRYLDADPLTICAENHRPPYASDGDYFSLSLIHI